MLLLFCEDQVLCMSSKKNTRKKYEYNDTFLYLYLLITMYFAIWQLFRLVASDETYKLNWFVVEGLRFGVISPVAGSRGCEYASGVRLSGKQFT